MEIKVIASGSSGNCYRVSDGETALLIECGISYKEIQRALSFKVNEISGCLITHEHKDHSKAMNDLTNKGIDCYATAGTARALSIESHRFRAIKHKETFCVGTFKILPFDVQHDAAEPIGFLLKSTFTGEQLLFITDSYYCKYTFDNVDYIMVECNYVSSALEENVGAGRVPEKLRMRIMKSHFSLDNVKTFLSSCNLTRTKRIYLIHLSEGNADERLVKEEIQRLTGKEIVVC